MDARELDEARFRTEGHRHIAVIEAHDPGAPGGVRTWRLWCMNCGLTGAHTYPDRMVAMKVATVLRAFVGPACQHRRRTSGDFSP